MTPKERLEEIHKQIEALEKERREIYQWSLTAPENQKVCSDFFARMLGEDDLETAPPEPLLVKKIIGGPPMYMESGPSRYGTPCWVAIRPCAEDCKGQTYLGLYIGDLATGVTFRANSEMGVMSVCPAWHNPAIWVFDLNRLVFGMESWWGRIKTPEDMKQITNQDIENTWYVQALKDLEKAAR